MRRGVAAAAILAVVASTGPPRAGAFAGGILGVTCSNPFPRQGDPVVVRAAPPSPVDNIAIRWKGRTIGMREEAPGRYFGLIGVDLEERPGPATFGVEAYRWGIRTTQEGVLTVSEGRFAVQRLTVPPSQAEFDNATLARIESERRMLDARLSDVSGAPRYVLPLETPLASYRATGFGARRVINGQPRSPHAGVDAKARGGTPVRAAAAGTVAFAAEQFFGGRSVVLSHGAGLFTLYYHLRDIAVREGQDVARGETIGTVGATGRAAGPHLHFGVRAPGGRVDPAALFERPVPGGARR